MAGEEKPKEQKQKTPQEMTLGEIVSKMIITDRKCVELEKDLAKVKSDEYWQNHPYPESSNTTISNAQRAYTACQDKYNELKRELDRKEKLYQQDNTNSIMRMIDRTYEKRQPVFKGPM